MARRAASEGLTPLHGPSGHVCGPDPAPWLRPRSGSLERVARWVRRRRPPPDGGAMSRLSRRMLAAVFAALSLAPAAAAAPGLLVGVDDDTLKWDEPQVFMPFARDLGLK